MAATHDEVDRQFTYQAPTDYTRPKHEMVRHHYTQLAHMIVDLCPESDEVDDAVRHLRMSMMLANASIATHR